MSRERLKQAFAGDESVLYVYRGLHGNHPALAAARSTGIVFAADPKATLTPGVHYAGEMSGRSQFSSWTYDYDVALRFARSRTPPEPVGIILRLRKFEPGPEDAWKWVRSPGEDGDEREVLLLGFRMDAEVVYDGSNEDSSETA